MELLDGALLSCYVWSPNKSSQLLGAEHDAATAWKHCDHRALGAVDTSWDGDLGWERVWVSELKTLLGASGLGEDM